MKDYQEVIINTLIMLLVLLGVLILATTVARSQSSIEYLNISTHEGRLTGNGNLVKFENQDSELWYLDDIGISFRISKEWSEVPGTQNKSVEIKDTYFIKSDNDLAMEYFENGLGEIIVTERYIIIKDSYGPVLLIKKRPTIHIVSVALKDGL